MGVRGRTNWSRREPVPDGDVSLPRRSFGFFPIAGKETRPAGRNPLREMKPVPKPAGGSGDPPLRNGGGNILRRRPSGRPQRAAPTLLYRMKPPSGGTSPYTEGRFWLQNILVYYPFLSHSSIESDSVQLHFKSRPRVKRVA